jgi:hypothetical protein
VARRNFEIIDSLGEDPMTTKYDKSDAVKAREALVEMGILRDSGRRRNGQILWELTELGKECGDEIIDAQGQPKH